MNGKTPGKNEKLVFRIPIETWEFFVTYILISLAEQSGIEDSKTPSEFLVRVMTDALNKEEQEDTFFSRVAYENAGIQNILLSEFWKQEVEPRIQVVRDHLKELDSALILQTMVSLAKTLDDAIVQLKHPKEKRTETDVIDDLLCDLMRFREKRKGPAGPYVEPLPDKRTVKKYKVFPVSSHMCCWPLFMRQDRVCAFPSGSTHPDYAAPV